MGANKTLLGVDLRVNSVKFVEIELTSEGAVVKNWGLTEIPYDLVDKHPEKEDAQAQALLKLLQTRQVKTTEAALVIGGSDVNIRLFTLAEVPREELLESLKWKFAEEIHFPVEEAIVDYYPLPRSANEPKEKKEFLAACINKKLYQDMEILLRKAGLKLAAVTILPDALQKVFEPTLQEDKDKIVALMYMGKRTTNISILKQGNMEFNRELNIGGENITLAMSGVLTSGEGQVEISPEKAEELKLAHGIPLGTTTYPEVGEAATTQLQAMVRPALERVEGEITRTFEYYKGQTGEASINEIIITGGSSLTGNLIESLGKDLNLPVKAANHFDKHLIDDNLPDKSALQKVFPRLSAALGAALVMTSRINLMPEDKKDPWEKLRRQVLKPEYLTLAFIALLLVIYGLLSLYGYWLQGQVNTMDAKLKQYAPRIASLEIMEKSTREDQRRRLLLDSYSQKRLSLPLLFQEISRVTPPSACINVLNLTPAELHIWGTVFAVGDTTENILSKFILALSSSPNFQEVKLVQAVQNTGYVQKALDFEIISQIKIEGKSGGQQ
jgi:type IV pilus assembly protein PilM